MFRFWRSYNSRRLNSNSRTLKVLLLKLKNQWSGYKNLCSFSIILNLERNYNVLKSKNPCFLSNQNINFNKDETESKMENPTYAFRETNLCASTHSKLKVKFCWVGARERKKSAFFVTFILLTEMFLILVYYLNIAIVYWTNLQNIYTFTYRKTVLYTLFCLFLKLLRAFDILLKEPEIKKSLR